MQNVEAEAAHFAERDGGEGHPFRDQFDADSLGVAEVALTDEVGLRDEHGPGAEKDEQPYAASQRRLGQNHLRRSVHRRAAAELQQLSSPLHLAAWKIKHNIKCACITELCFTTGRHTSA